MCFIYKLQLLLSLNVEFHHMTDTSSLISATLNCIALHNLNFISTHIRTLKTISKSRMPCLADLGSPVQPQEELVLHETTPIEKH